HGCPFLCSSCRQPPKECQLQLIRHLFDSAWTEVGNYSKSVGVAMCKRCPFGSYGNSFGLTSCVKCPKGTWTRAQGSIRADQCSSWVKPQAGQMEEEKDAEPEEDIKEEFGGLTGQ
ncbi:unnamed protein product, partial [Effrenium voratum]